VFRSRFGLLDPAWYWHNLLAEHTRYGPGLGALGAGDLLRPGLWMTALLAPLGVVGLARRAARERDPAARSLVLPLIMFPSLFALLITSKVASYLLVFWPLVAVAVGWAGWWLWQRWGAQAAEPGLARWLRATLALVVLAAGLEGAGRIWALEQAAAAATPYASFMGQVRGRVLDEAGEAPARVLGLHTFWLGVHDLGYVTWLLPVRLARLSEAGAGAPLTVTLGRLDPTVVLVDPRMREYINSDSPGDTVPGDIAQWLKGGYELAAVLDDPTYGPMEIYRRLATGNGDP
jgi:hypothetical protein